MVEMVFDTAPMRKISQEERLALGFLTLARVSRAAARKAVC